MKFAVLVRKFDFVVLMENMNLQFRHETHFCGFSEKNILHIVLLGICVFLWFWWENASCEFPEKMRFVVLTRIVFVVLAKNVFFRFWQKNVFCGFGGKMYFWFWRKMRFVVLAGNIFM